MSATQNNSSAQDTCNTISHQAEVAAAIREYATLAEASKNINLHRSSIRLPGKPKAGMSPAITFARLQFRKVNGDAIELFAQVAEGNSYTTDTTMCVAGTVSYSSNGNSKDVQAIRRAAGLPADMVYPAMPSVTIPVVGLRDINANDYAILSGANSGNLAPLVDIMADCCTILQCMQLAIQDGLRERVKEQIITTLTSLKNGQTDPTILRTLDAKIRCASSARICGFKSLYQNKNGGLMFSLELQTDGRKKMDEDPLATINHKFKNITHATEVEHPDNMGVDAAIELLRRGTLIVAEFKFVMMTTTMGFVMQLRCHGDIRFAHQVVQVRSGRSAAPTLVYNGVTNGTVCEVKPAESTVVESTVTESAAEEWEGE
jgi:hypothetical protein